ncbi:MAG TPA: hypothetical protein VMF09_13810 [Solirubrobacteraceae bacterium]|nr:hypothetical protein [Solirubrobacteraceae bacterium]
MSTPGELLEALGRQARARLTGGGDELAAHRTRVYRGRSVDELIPVIQRELGPEAIVVRRREGLTGGVLGFFQHAYVEIEAMPGVPGVDVYDEDQAAPAPAPYPPPQPGAFEPPAPASSPEGEPAPAPRDPGRERAEASRQSPASQAPPPGATAASPAPFAPPSPEALPPPPPAAPAASSASAQPHPPSTPAAPAPQGAPGFPATPPPRPALGYWPAPRAQAPAVAPAEVPDSTPPSATEGSAYVTAHLAALARANRARPGARQAGAGATPPLVWPEPASRRLGPPLARPELPFAKPRPKPSRPAPAPAPAARERVRPRPAPEPAPEPPRERTFARAPERGPRESLERGPRVRESPERVPLTWSGDYQELPPEELPELYPPVAERAQPSRTSAAGERRVVAPGSHGRARAGVAKSLRRYGISEALANELIDGASAHALALAPRAGLAQGVRATLAQRIPVAPALPTRGAAIVVVGAGGAGKTTCCAALLGAYRRSSSLRASFATITRAGERGELHMVLSPYLMRPTPARTTRAVRALARARKEGMAVLDTPSLSPSDRAGVRELAGLLAALEPERVVVALPATLGPGAAAQLLGGLRPLAPTSLAVTHADETDQIGVAVEAACLFGLAPEYLLERGRGGGWRLHRVDPAGLAARLLP